MVTWEDGKGTGTATVSGGVAGMASMEQSGASASMTPFTVDGAGSVPDAIVALNRSFV